MSLALLKQEISQYADPQRAKSCQWFFKTGKGEYGYGDKFLGLTVPSQRKIAKRHQDLGFSDILKLLRSPYHEHRFVALEILVMQYEQSFIDRKKIIGFYLKNARYANNWDLVDTSAPYILGHYLLDKPKDILYKLAGSKNVWERRIAIVSTLRLIGDNDVDDALKLSKKLLHDDHDLIRKATGWVLREVGKKDAGRLRRFLDKYHRVMPRTMLRYAIERLPASKRTQYMKR